MRSLRSTTAPAQRQRGAASLIVVVIVLAAMAMAALYTNRNLVMETRISANQMRATVAMEAAEAGLEWAAAMLNKPETIGNDCQSSTANTAEHFKQRYLSVDITNGAITPLALSGGVHVACTSDQAGGAWSCSCPAPGTAPSLTTPTAAGLHPSFAVGFVANPATPGTVQVVSYGCTSRITSDTCEEGDAAATVRVTLAALSGLATPPAAPLTARGKVDIGNAALGVINGDPTSNGITINAGLGIDADNARVITVPGTPPRATMVGNDPTLRDTTEAQLFSTFFGISKDSYKNLPSVKRYTCPCTETTISTAYNQGVRQMWLDGNLAMNANLTIGSIDDPVMIIVDGTIEMRGDLEVYGLIYSTAITWDSTGGGSALLRGAAISEGNYTGNGTPDYFYDTQVLTKLRYDQGSFVRVPGSWRDW